MKKLLTTIISALISVASFAHPVNTNHLDVVYTNTPSEWGDFNWSWSAASDQAIVLDFYGTEPSNLFLRLSKPDGSQYLTTQSGSFSAGDGFTRWTSFVAKSNLPPSNVYRTEILSSSDSTTNIEDATTLVMAKGRTRVQWSSFDGSPSTNNVWIYGDGWFTEHDLTALAALAAYSNWAVIAMGAIANTNSARYAYLLSLIQSEELSRTNADSALQTALNNAIGLSSTNLNLVSNELAFVRGAVSTEAVDRVAADSAITASVAVLRGQYEETSNQAATAYGWGNWNTNMVALNYSVSALSSQLSTIAGGTFTNGVAAKYFFATESVSGDYYLSYLMRDEDFGTTNGISSGGDYPYWRNSNGSQRILTQDSSITVDVIVVKSSSIRDGNFEQDSTNSAVFGHISATSIKNTNGTSVLYSGEAPTVSAWAAATTRLASAEAAVSALTAQVASLIIQIPALSNYVVSSDSSITALVAGVSSRNVLTSNAFVTADVTLTGMIASVASAAALSDGVLTTNLLLADGVISTNYLLANGVLTTNLSALSASVGLISTNYPLADGVVTTNLTLAIGVVHTNYGLADGVLRTNMTTATNALWAAISTGLTNVNAVQLGGAIPGAYMLAADWTALSTNIPFTFKGTPAATNSTGLFPWRYWDGTNVYDYFESWWKQVGGVTNEVP